MSGTCTLMLSSMVFIILVLIFRSSTHSELRIKWDRVLMSFSFTGRSCLAHLLKMFFFASVNYVVTLVEHQVFINVSVYCSTANSISSFYMFVIRQHHTPSFLWHSGKFWIQETWVLPTPFYSSLASLSWLFFIPFFPHEFQDQSVNVFEKKKKQLGFS